MGVSVRATVSSGVGPVRAGAPQSIHHKIPKELSTVVFDQVLKQDDSTGRWVASGFFRSNRRGARGLSGTTAGVSGLELPPHRQEVARVEHKIEMYRHSTYSFKDRHRYSTTSTTKIIYPQNSGLYYPEYWS